MKTIGILNSCQTEREQLRAALEGNYRIVEFSNLEEIAFIYGCYKNGNYSLDALISEFNLEDGHILEFIKGSSFTKEVTTFIVSKKSDKESIRAAFDAGVADYFASPIDSNEIEVKMDRFLENERKGDIVAFNDFDPMVLNSLTMKELKIFQLMWKSPKHTCSKVNIYKEIWNGVTVGSRTLDVHLHNLRNKIRRHGLTIVSKEPGQTTIMAMSN